MTTAFEEAKRELRIDSVLLRESVVFLADEIDSDDLEKLESEAQSFRGVEKVKELGFHVDETDTDKWEYHFFYSVGVRLVEKGNDEKVFLKISSVFNAKYVANKKLDVTIIEAFAEENVGYHVWPFWRETVQSTCSKLDVKPIHVPFYTCQSSQTDNPES